MKRFFLFVLCTIMMTVYSANIQAQNQPEKKQRPSREELAEKQARHIAHALAFDDATTQKFVTTYQEFRNELKAIEKPKKHGESGSIKERLDYSQKVLDLRKKYYNRYSQFLTERQIERAYELDHQAMRRMASHRRGQGQAFPGRRPFPKHPATQRHHRRS